MKPKQLLLAQLAEQINAQLIGDGNRFITGINTIQDAGENDVCFLFSEKHAKSLEQTKAAAVIVDKKLSQSSPAMLIVDNVHRGLIDAMTIFAPKLKAIEGIHPSAVIDPDAVIDPGVAIGAGVHIAAGVRIGADSVIGHGCVIGQNSTIGTHTRLDSNVVVYHNCQIGSFCVIQANSTIGSTGFGYSFIDGQHRLVPHNGGVIIEDGVEIGANSCVDRAKFGNTVIGAGTKIDNLVQVAHNVQIGKLCLLAGHVGIAGSTQVGNGVIFAGAAGAADNVQIGDGAILGAQAAAVKNIAAGEKVLGHPPQEITRELRCVSVYHRLPELAKELKKLQQKVKTLEAAKDD